MKNMKKQLLKTTAAFAMAAAMVISPLTLKSVYADTSSISINKGECDFTSDLVMKKSATVPDVTFTYTIAKATANQLSGTIEVPKVDALPTISTTSTGTSSKLDVPFTSEDTTIDESGADDNHKVKFATSEVGDEKLVEKQLHIDFSNVNITDPGTYRYVLTQNTSTKEEGKGISYDNKVSYSLNDKVQGSGIRYLDLTVVRKDNTGTNDDVEYKYSLHKVDESVKSDGFINTYDSNDLTITKSVAGSQGNKNEYFKFSFAINKELLQKGFTISYSGLDNEITYEGNTVTNPTKISIKDGEIGNDTKSIIFYLKHGSTMTIKGISWHAGYSLKEYETKKGYTVTSNIVGDTLSEGRELSLIHETTDKVYSLTDATFADDTKVTYINTLNGAIPTGVIMSVLPGLAVVAVGAIGIIYFARKKKRHI